MNIKWLCVLAACASLFAMGKQMALQSPRFAIWTEAALALVFAVLAGFVRWREVRHAPKENNEAQEPVAH